MFVNMITMRVMQVAVVQVISLAVMQHGSVAAVRAVLMVVVGVVRCGAGSHSLCPW